MSKLQEQLCALLGMVGTTLVAIVWNQQSLESLRQGDVLNYKYGQFAVYIYIGCAVLSFAWFLLTLKSKKS